MSEELEEENKIAVIALEGRFPGAQNVDEFWKNLCEGKESITPFSDEELLESGVDPELIKADNYIKARGYLENIDSFDSAYFDMSPREGELMDPQHRIFLQCAHHVLEKSGYNPEFISGPVGVYAGLGFNHYFLNNILSNIEILKTSASQIMYSNDKDFMAAFCSYKLNLKGPAQSIQTACSSSLVAVHNACQALMDYQCDMALAGGVSLNVPSKSGYMYYEGGVESPDGHCRPFDAKGKGTVMSDGVGIVLLKRYEDAIEDGDTIHAVILGGAVNNDGSDKVGFTAPSVSGQARVIALAHAIAEVEPESIRYVETHGTGTNLGDPVEFEALASAFKLKTDKKQFCSIGSVKSNIGHLNTASGVAGLIKAILTLKHRQVPPSLFYQNPNPMIDFKNSPFYVNTELKNLEPEKGNGKLRAGVSSFGIGGTNVHMILEEPPPQEIVASPEQPEIFLLSTRSEDALDRSTKNLSNFIESQSELDMKAAAHTLYRGRRMHEHRRVLVADNRADALDILRGVNEGLLGGVAERGIDNATFMFPGQGSQFVGMGFELYERFEFYRKTIDECAAILSPILKCDIKDIMFGSPGAEATEKLNSTEYAQPALFITEYALAKLWIHLGVTPRALIGHSLGEYAAACLSGVFSLEGALKAVARRSSLVGELPEGGMLSVQLSEAALKEKLIPGVEIGVVNGPEFCVLSGQIAPIKELEEKLNQEGVQCKRLFIHYASHSSMMEPVLESFREVFQDIQLNPPEIPLLSNVSGDWLKESDACSADYWVNHIRNTVRFADGAALLLKETEGPIIEMAPGRSLISLIQANENLTQERVLINSLPMPRDNRSQDGYFLESLGRYWLKGGEIQWQHIFGKDFTKRIEMPGYPFAETSHWLKPGAQMGASAQGASRESVTSSVPALFLPQWKQVGPLPQDADESENNTWLVFTTETSFESRFMGELEKQGQNVIKVIPGEELDDIEGGYCINGEDSEDYDTLFADIDIKQGNGKTPNFIVNFWSKSEGTFSPEAALNSKIFIEKLLREGVWFRPARFFCISDNLSAISAVDRLEPTRFLLKGDVVRFGAEESNSSSVLDIVFPGEKDAWGDSLIRNIIGDLRSGKLPRESIFRGPERWDRQYNIPDENDFESNSALVRAAERYIFVGALSRSNIATLLKLALIDEAQILFVHVPTKSKNALTREVEETEVELEVLRKAGIQIEEHKIESGLFPRGILEGKTVQGVFLALDDLSELDETSLLELGGRGAKEFEELLQEVKKSTPEFCLLLNYSSGFSGQKRINVPVNLSFLESYLMSERLQDTISFCLVNIQGEETADLENVDVMATATAVLIDKCLTLRNLPGEIQLDPTAYLSAGVSQTELKGIESASAPEGSDARRVDTIYVAPETEIETEVVKVWRDLLGVRTIGVNDNFFELGGHSMMATQFLARIGPVLEVRLTLFDFFEAGTVRKLGKIIEHHKSHYTEELEQIPQIERGGDLRASFGQERMSFLQTLNPNDASYNMWVNLILDGSLEHKVFEQAINVIVARHESLRCVLLNQDDRLNLVIRPELHIPLEKIDLTSEPKESKSRRLEEEVHREVHKPFDLGTGPLIRCILTKLDEKQYGFTLIMHHIISDGWSLNVFVNELGILLGAAIRKDKNPKIPSLDVQYPDFAQWQRGRIDGDYLEKLMGYWTQRLAGKLPVMRFPTDYERSGEENKWGSHKYFEVPPELTNSLKDLASEEQATIFMVLFAAFNALLLSYTGQEDILIGAPIANRNHPALESLIGFFVNTIVFRTNMENDPGFRELLGRVRKNMVSDYEHQDLPFDKLVEQLKPEKDFGYNPVFQSMFIFQNMPKTNIEFEEMRIGAFETEFAPLRTEFDLYLSEEEGVIAGSFVYDVKLFKAETIELLCRRYVELLKKIAADPGASLSRLLLEAPPEPPRIIKRTGTGLLKLSEHQQRMWFIDEFERGSLYESSPIYHNMSLVLKLEGVPEYPVMMESLKALTARHEILRTHCIREEDVNYQHISPAEDWMPEFWEINGAIDPDDKQALENAALVEIQRPFDLNGRPPFRVVLIKLAKGQSLLVIVAHHFIADRPSFDILGQELLEIYKAKEKAGEPTLSPLAVQYGNIVDSRENQGALNSEALLHYWRLKLRGRIQALTIPEDRSRPAVHTYTAGFLDIDPKPEIVKTLADLARSKGVSSPAAYLAVFKVLMRRYSGLDEIVVGIPTNGRDGGREGILGPLSNLVVTRDYLKGEAKFSDVLTQVSWTLTEALDFGDISFEILSRELNPAKDMSRTALFDIFFQYINEAFEPENFGGMKSERLEANYGHGKYDMNLLVRETQGGVRIRLTYNTDIFDAAGMEQMMGHYFELAGNLAAEPETIIDEVPLLLESESRVLLKILHLESDYPRAATLHFLFEAQVVNFPECIALTCGKESLTYKQLNEEANRLAHYLRERDVGPDVLVGVLMQRTVRIIPVLLGILKAGGAYLPLDADSPVERLEMILEDAKVSQIFLDSMDALSSETTELLKNPEIEKTLVHLDAIGDELKQKSSSNPAPLSKPENLAYCIYTSGSTGKPKGALIEHRNVVRLMVNDKLQFQFSENDVWSLFHSFHFDFSVWEMYGALLYGGRVVVVTKETTRDPALFLDLLEKEKVTVLSQTPSAFYQLSDLALERQSELAALRYVVFGGEALDPLRLKNWNAANSDVKLINMYGITETTVHVTFKELTAEDLAGHLSNIGGPIPTTSVYVLDEKRRLLPPGITGELYVGGLGVSRGYLNRPELTEERFIQSDFQQGERLYRTGDLGKILRTGDIAYLGRMDDQVQIRGFRVELGEIRAALLKHESLTSVAVIAERIRMDNPEVAAYYVAGKSIEADEIRNYLASLLPPYMVPSFFIPLDAMPLTSNGKVDFRALPSPEDALQSMKKDFVAPRNTVEAKLAEIWGEVLGVSDIGVTDNFFELGGHSLLATQVVSRIRTDLNQELELQKIFENPALEELANFLISRGVESTDAGPGLVAASRDQNLPLSFAQQRLWFIDKMKPNMSAYNMPMAVRIKGLMDREELEKQLQVIVQRHETLRTKIDEIKGEAVQNIEPKLFIPLTLIKVTEQKALENEVALEEFVSEEARTPFQLNKGPLVRCTLFEITPENHILLVNMHHIITDGWSIDILLRELMALYGAVKSGDKEFKLPDLPIQYADFALWQREWMQGEVLEKQMSYWKSRLSGELPVLQLPTDFPRSRVQTFEGSSESFSISKGVSQNVRELCEKSGATIFMVFGAALNLLLSKFTDSDDIILGMPIANRNRLEIEKLIGFFVNTLALRTDLSGNPTFYELLERVRVNTMEAYEHQDLPFEKLVDEIEPGRDMSRTPIFQVMFVLQNIPVAEINFSDVEVIPYNVEMNSSHFDLIFQMVDDPEGLRGAIEYNTDLYKAESIRRLSTLFESLLGRIAKKPDAPISSLSLLDEAEKKRLTQDFNKTENKYPAQETLQVLFEKNVKENPEAIAIITETGAVSYGELNHKSNQIAHHLRKKGVGLETPVGLCMNRSLFMLTAMLGVIKAGGVYIPLDSTYPLERISYMIEDSGISHLISLEQHSELLRDFSENLILLDKQSAEVNAESQENPAPLAGGDNLAYVIYTSGSTGQPKGTGVPQKAVSRLVLNTDYVEFTPEDRLAHIASVSFDASTFEIWGALLNGCALYLYERDVLLSPKDFGNRLQKDKISHLFITTALFNQLAALDAGFFNGLRYLLFGGEAVNPEPVRRVLESGGPERLLHVYGPTENTTFSTWFHVEAVAEEEATISIGKPIANSTYYVLNKELSPVPVGAQGELYVGGEGLARDYRNRPELTAEKFVPNPFSKFPGERLYRTGDLVQMQADGNIIFVGRIDKQVKIRGYRIEIGEIEAVLRTHGDVKEVFVMVREDIPGSKQVVAYIICRAGVNLKQEDLKSFLNEKVPDYMTPSAFAFMSKFPLTVNGKVNHRQLPAPELGSELGYVAPRNDKERILCEIWSEVLRVEQIGVHDNFFQLGGDSILSIQITARAAGRGLNLSTREIFEHQTVAELALTAGERLIAGAEQGVVTGNVPLTPVQKWFFGQKLANVNYFNQSMMLDAPPELTSEILQSVIKELLRTHDALRMRYEQNDGGWTQFIVPPDECDVILTEIDLEGLKKEEAGAKLNAALRETQSTLNLLAGPLMQTLLIKRGGGKSNQVFMVVHHLVVDGVSWRILLSDFQELCVQIGTGKEINLPPKSTSISYWAEQLSEYARTELTVDSILYWNAIALEKGGKLSRDKKQKDNTEAALGKVTVTLDEKRTRALLTEIHTAYNTRVNDVLLLALGMALEKFNGKAAYSIHLESHGREEILKDVDLSRTVGWFTSVFPFLIDVPDSKDIGKSLKYIKEKLRNVPGNGIHYGLLKYLKGEELKHLDVEISFNYLGQFDNISAESNTLELEGLESIADVAPENERHHLLDIVGAVYNERLEMNFLYGENIHNRGSIEGLAGFFAEALNEVIEHCGRPDTRGVTVSDFPLVNVSQERLEQLLTPFENVLDVYPLSHTQQGILFHSLLSGENSDYYIGSNFKIKGEFDVKSFQAAWQALVERHDVLRTCFIWEDLKEPLQIVQKSVLMPFEYLDWSGQDLQTQQKSIKEFIEEDLRKGFNLNESPAMRVTVARLGATEYEVFWNYHHIILDGWSMPLVFKELFEFYGDICAGGRTEYSPLVPYRNYIEYLRSKDSGAADSFWKQYLQGFEAPIELGIEKDSVNTGAENKQGIVGLDVGVGLTEAIRNFAGEHRLTLNVIIQGAIAIVMQRYSRLNDVVFGTVVAGRPAELKGVEEIVGLFINTLPLRVQFDASNSSLLAYLESLQKNFLELRQHESSFLLNIQRLSNVPQGTPLFNAIVAFENYPMEESTGGGEKPFRIEEFEAQQHTNYPLNITVTPGKDINIRVEFDTRLYELESVRKFLQHTTMILQGIMDTPEAPLGSLGLLTEQERNLLANEWNQTRTDFPEARGLSEVFGEQAKVTPDAPAIEMKKETFTYRELNEGANRLAHLLISKGVGPEQTVAICLRRSPAMVTAILAVLKAGAVYVPLDPDHPGERLQYIISNSNSSLLLSDKKGLPPGLEGMQGEIILLDEQREQIAAQEITDPGVNIRDENLAYILYTSGTSGNPKGVQITHGGLMNYLNWNIATYPIDDGQGSPLHSSIGFDLTVTSLFPPLLRGKKVVLMPEEDVVHNLAKSLSGESDYSVVKITPAHLEVIKHEVKESLGSGTRSFVIGGEALTYETVSFLLENSPEVRIFNEYGPTETVVGCAIYELGQDTGTSGNVSIGTAIANTSLYVLNSRMELMPTGVAGELYVGGAGLARGYRDSPGLTAEKFLPNPFSKEPGSRLYRTGDLARWGHDGRLEYLGRIDNQIKIRGFRVELGEIENVLGRETELRQVAVSLREDVPGDKRVVAYVVPASGPGAETKVDFEKLKIKAAEHLPEYMLPSDFVALEALPLTVNGKIDYRALPAPARERTEKVAYEAPVGRLEKDISAIWAEVLGLKEVGVEDNFFDLGGHSLLLIQVSSRLKGIGIDLPMIRLFEYPTIRLFSEFVKQGDNQEAFIKESDEEISSLKKGKSRLLDKRRRSKSSS